MHQQLMWHLIRRFYNGLDIFTLIDSEDKWFHQICSLVGQGEDVHAVVLVFAKASNKVHKLLDMGLDKGSAC